MKTLNNPEMNAADRNHAGMPHTAALRSPVRAVAEMHAGRKHPGLKLSADLCNTRILNAYCSEVCCETTHGRVCNTYCNDPA